MNDLNIQSIIEENSKFTSMNSDSSETKRIALLKSAEVDEIHLFKFSGNSTPEQLARLKDNLGWRIETSINTQEKNFLKAFYSIISHALIMKRENKDITHISLPFHKEEISHFNYRDLAILNEIDLFHTRLLHQAQMNDPKYQKLEKLAKQCFHICVYLGQKLWVLSKKGLIQLHLFMIKLKKKYLNKLS